MTDLSLLDDISMKTLAAIQEAVQGSPDGQVSMWQVGEKLGLERGLMQDLAMDLAGLGLLEVKSLSGKVSLTEAGQAFSQGRPSPAGSAKPDLAGLVGLIETGLEALGLGATAKQDLAIDLAVLRGQMSRSERLAPVMAATLEAVRQALAAAPKPADPAWVARLDDFIQAARLR